jgi:hypothetical protein
VNPSYRSFGGVMSIGDTCFYAIILPGSQYETGLGTYSGTNTLTRTTVFETSGGSPANFAAGTKDVFIALPASQSQAFPSGTLMLFQQSTAPMFWTKQTTHNDKALRVVSGTAGSGGANAFSSTLNSTLTTSNTTITTATMPSHTHNISYASSALNLEFSGAGNQGGQGITTASTSAGADGPHNHTLGFNVFFVDVILAQKD